MITPTKESLDLTKDICEKINKLTFHLHYHILYDIANTYDKDKTINYLEIGCYGGGSASLMVHRPKTNVTSVDLGGPIPMSVAVDNVKSFNKFNNIFNYVKGNSHSKDTAFQVSNIMNAVDILFIDGDHSFNGVIQDFKMYSEFVVDGGYIIFDDYADAKYSPEVKDAVDHILMIDDNIIPIGQLENTFEAPSMLEDNSKNNCFIVQCYR